MRKRERKGLYKKERKNYYIRKRERKGLYEKERKKGTI